MINCFMQGPYWQPEHFKCSYMMMTLVSMASYPFAICSIIETMIQLNIAMTDLKKDLLLRHYNPLEKVKKYLYTMKVTLYITIHIFSTITDS